MYMTGICNVLLHQVHLSTCMLIACMEEYLNFKFKETVGTNYVNIKSVLVKDFGGESRTASVQDLSPLKPRTTLLSCFSRFIRANIQQSAAAQHNKNNTHVYEVTSIT